MTCSTRPLAILWPSLGVFKDELCIDENLGGFEAFRVSHPRFAMEGSGLTSIFMPHLSA